MGLLRFKNYQGARADHFCDDKYLSITVFKGQVVSLLNNNLSVILSGDAGCSQA